MRAALCIVLVACAGTPAKPGTYRAPVSTGRVAYAETPKYRPALAPAPPLDLAVVIPDYDESRPWPLAELPSVQPHWDPAMAHDACSDEWKARHMNDAEAKAYVAAWCRLKAQDRGAIDALGMLARSARSEIAKPARLDVVNLAADWWDAKHAVAWLDSMSLGSTANIDLLTGTYVALGMRDQARAVKRDGPISCEGFIETARVGDPGLVDHLQSCGANSAHVLCMLELAGLAVTGGPVRCQYIVHGPEDRDVKLNVLRQYARFETAPKDAARSLVDSLGVPGAEEVAVTALENWTRSLDCKPDPDIALIAAKLLAADSHSTVFDARLAKLRAKPAGCM